MDLRQLIQRLKFVRAKDIASIPAMCVGFIVSVPFRMTHRNIWLICERECDARDNGYWFYKYMCENHPEIESVYAINKKSKDYQKVASMGKTIQFGSLTHWVYYFAAKWNISSQKEGKPNAALCFILEVYLNMVQNRVFLQHGITKDTLRWLFYDVSKINLFCCAAQREHKYVVDTFGYRPEKIVLTGLCRFDNLLAPHQVKRQILVIPTMREWLKTISSDTLKYEKTKDFCQSEYFVTWSSFIHNGRLHEVLEVNNIDLLFYPHPSMQKYKDQFKTECSRITIASSDDYDMQQLLMESAMLITDYSSIYFDFAYMKKPLIYYQFDYDKYRKGQYQEGYFSYKDDGFGPVVYTEDALFAEIEKCIADDLKMPRKYSDRTEDFFAFRDCDNCRRTYKAIQGE